MIPMNKKRLKSAIFFPKNRRGQDTSPIAVIVGIILAIAVLVVLILGFTLGWDKIVPWLPKDNIQTIVTQCNVACSLNNKYDFCTNTRTLKDANNKELINPVDNAVGQFTGTCFEMTTNEMVTKYGIASCPTINCQA